MALRKNGGTIQSSSGSSQKGLNMQWLYQLTQVAEGLMVKMYRLNQILDFPDLVCHIYSEAFWKSGVFPNHPKICILLAKKFPEHHSKLQLERVDKFALDAMTDSAEVHLQSLELWIQLLLDLMTFREQALRLILDLSSTVITLLPPKILSYYMPLWTSFAPLFMLTYFLRRSIQFVDSYDPPLKGLREDLNFVSPRIGERAQDLANVTCCGEWALFGYLVCPDVLLRVTSIDIALVVLKESLVLTLFMDEVVDSSDLKESIDINTLSRMAMSPKPLILRQNSFSAEASVKSTMQLFVKFSAGIILESWKESNRSYLVVKLIFLDQLCELSPYLSRSLLESHVPYAILRAIYSQYYSNSSTFLSSSLRYSPAMLLAHASPASKQPYGDSTPQSSVNDSGHFKASSTHGQDQYDTENGSIRSADIKHHNARRSGPLDYSLSHKTKFVEGSTSSSTGPSPLPRFAVSRSGPIRGGARIQVQCGHKSCPSLMSSF